jgi:hypothetical protein
MLKKGFCDKQHCRYAHNAEELRTQAGLLKTKMCNFYMKGLCVVGQACRFAHSKEELQEALTVQKVAAPFPPTQPRCTDPELWERRRRAFGLHPSARAGAPGASGNSCQEETVVYSPQDARGSEDETNEEVGNVEPAQVVRGRVVVELDDDSAPSPLEPAPLPKLLGGKSLDDDHKVWVDTDCEDVIEELCSNSGLMPDDNANQPVYYGDTDDEECEGTPAGLLWRHQPAHYGGTDAASKKGVRVITKNTFLTIAGYTVGADSVDAA